MTQSGYTPAEWDRLSPEQRRDAAVAAMLCRLSEANEHIESLKELCRANGYDSVTDAVTRAKKSEAMLGELVAMFNPEPKTPAVTIWDRAAAVLQKPKR